MRSLFALTLATVLAAVVWLPLEDEAAPRQDDRPPALVPPGAPSLAMDELARRPLFTASRRPVAAQPAVAVRGAGAPPVPVLRGVIRSGGPAIVMFEDPADRRVHRAPVGGASGSWFVVSEDKGNVVLRHTRTREEKRLTLPQAAATGFGR